MNSLDDGEHSIDFSEYVLAASLPEYVSVTDGSKHKTKLFQINEGDVLVLKSCVVDIITLTYKDEVSGRRKNIEVSRHCPQKFVVLPPKEASSSRAVSVIMYPTISDLLIDSPTYFEATSSYNDTDINGTSINRGDRFKFRGISASPGDGQKRLKALDNEGNVTFLSLDCRGNFYPLEDVDSYTLNELISFAPVPRRLKLSTQNENDAELQCSSLVQSNSSCHFSNSTSLTEPSAIKSSSLPLWDLQFLSSISGAIHMLKPDVSVNVSPLNDQDTVWTLPISANLRVKEYIMDDYEIPSVVMAKKTVKPMPSQIDSLEQVPDFPAPSTPPLPQPLVPVNVNNFIDIYGNSFPLKAKIMDVKDCSPFYRKAFQDCGDVIIHKCVNIQKLYAKDLKSKTVYSFSNTANVSFIEYPQKFESIFELIDLPVGSEVVVLEDIASDFPKAFSLQFGDIIRVTSNSPVRIKVKHSELECKILKCERVNHDDKHSTTKLRLPLDFDVKMMISTDYTDKKIISIEDLISRKVLPPTGDVATLIDSGESTDMKSLPPNLNGLEMLSEKFLIVSLPDILNGMVKSSSNAFLGVSVNSRLVLAFRQRLDPSDKECLLPPEAQFVQEPLETLSSDDFEDRKQQFKLQIDEEKQEMESICSSDKYSTSGDSLQRTNSQG